MQEVDTLWEKFKISKGAEKQETFQKLFENLHKLLCYFTNRIIRNNADAEDIVQDIFLQLWKMNPTEYCKIRTIQSFLYASTQNRCLNYLRNREIRTRNYKNLNKEELDEDYFLCKQIQTEVIAELFEAIEELPDKCKEIFKRSYIDGQEDKKIAEELNISLNTIKTQKKRAKNYLRLRLKDLFLYVVMIFPD